MAWMVFKEPRELPDPTSVDLSRLLRDIEQFDEQPKRLRLSREEYREQYLQSEEWRTLRSMTINARGRRCEDCGFSDGTTHLDVHHLTYERLGYEILDDLLVVCRRCHDKRHGR